MIGNLSNNCLNELFKIFDLVLTHTFMLCWQVFDVLISASICLKVAL